MYERRMDETYANASHVKRLLIQWQTGRELSLYCAFTMLKDGKNIGFVGHESIFHNEISHI